MGATELRESQAPRVTVTKSHKETGVPLAGDLVSRLEAVSCALESSLYWECGKKKTASDAFLFPSGCEDQSSRAVIQSPTLCHPLPPFFFFFSQTNTQNTKKHKRFPSASQSIKDLSWFPRWCRISVRKRRNKESDCSF